MAWGGAAVSGSGLAPRLRAWQRLPARLLLQRIGYLIKTPFYRSPLYGAGRLRSEPGAIRLTPPDPWPGNAAPRVHETPAGMINSVGLQGPGVQHWLDAELPELLAIHATVVASIWGTTVEDYERAAKLLADAPPQVVAVEVNLSCPNHHHRDERGPDRHRNLNRHSRPGCEHFCESLQ